MNSLENNMHGPIFSVVGNTLIKVCKHYHQRPCRQAGTQQEQRMPRPRQAAPT